MNRAKNSYERIQKGIDFIEEHLTEPINPRQVAFEACFSVPHFYRLFHALVGYPVKEYIRRRRLHLAAIRLTETDDRLIDICLDYQFSFQESFTRAFLSTYGITPGRFRKQPRVIQPFPRMDLVERFFVPGEVNMLDPGIKVLKRLPPMVVAGCRSFGRTPERDAWNTLLNWADRRGMLKDSRPYRIFGFDNPPPSPGAPEHGYEFWITVEEGTRADDPVRIVRFEGGHYAVTGTTIPEIQTAWKRFMTWLEISKYRRGSHRCLEEHLSPMGTPEEKMQIDLYLPISPPQYPKGGNA